MVAVEAANGGLQTLERKITMYTIGTFSKKDTGQYQGTINSLGLTTKAVFVPLKDKMNDKAPDFRVISDKGVEFGAAWNRTAETSGNEYLSVTLDAPSLPARIYCRLMKGEKDFDLIWSRD
jgi:uncharacterized protein (DUF736 family)